MTKVHVKSGEESQAPTRESRQAPTRESRREAVKFRRKSVNDGILIPDDKQPASIVDSRQVSAFVASDIASEFVDTVRFSENVSVKIKDFLEVNDVHGLISEHGKEFTDILFLKLSDLINRSLKMDRKGALLNIMASLLCSYADLASDVMMLFYYEKAGDESSFQSMAIVLGIALFTQGCLGFIFSAHLPPRRRLRRFVQGIVCLNPLYYAFGKWTGNRKEEGTTVAPATILAKVKFCELIFESMPMMIIQLSALLDADGIDLRPIISICFSVLSVGWVLTDLSIGFERSLMADNIRGPYSTHWIGLYPEKNQRYFFLSHLLFETGYFACVIFAYSTVKKTQAFIFTVCDYALFHLLLMCTRRGRYTMQTSNSIGSLDIFRPEWISISVAPILLLSSPPFLGGSINSKWILYRLTAATAAVLSSNNLSERMGLVRLFFAALVAAVVGMLGLVTFSSSTHRSNLWRENMHPRSNVERWFGPGSAFERLDYAHTTLDEARMHWMAATHPYFLIKSQTDVKSWLLGLQVTDELFQGRDIPPGVERLAGQSFPTGLKVLQEKYRYFNDKDGDEAIRLHFNFLLASISDRALQSQNSAEEYLRNSRGASLSKEVGERETIINFREEVTASALSPAKNNAQFIDELQFVLQEREGVIKEMRKLITNLQEENKKLREEKLLSESQKRFDQMGEAG